MNPLDLKYVPEYYGNSDYEEMPEEIKKLAKRVPEKIANWVLDGGLVEGGFGDKRIRLHYKSALKGFKGTWSAQPAWDQPSANVHVKWEGGKFLVTFTTLWVGMELDGANTLFEEMPAFRHYRRDTLKGFLRMADRLARMFGYTMDGAGKKIDG